MENHDTIPFYAAVLPNDPWQMSIPSLIPFWLCYQVGNGPRLYRCTPSGQVHGGILCASDRSFAQCGGSDTFCQQVLRECHATGAGGFCANWSRSPTPATQKLISTLENVLTREGLSFFVTLPYADACEHGSILLSTALSRQPLTQRLRSACEVYGSHRIILTFESTAADYLLPVPPQGGKLLSVSQVNTLKSRYSPVIYHDHDLLFHYFTYEQQAQTHLTLFDDEETFYQKKQLAEELQLGGFLAVYREISSYCSRQQIL